MFYNHVRLLIKLDFLYMMRKLFHAGILKSKIIRILIITAFIFLEFFLSGLMTFFFHVNHSSIRQTSAVLDTYVCNVLLYTLIAFLILKQAFLKKNALISLATPFPVTPKERQCSLEIFELIFTLGIVFAFSLSMLVSCLLTNGLQMIIPLINNVIFTAITTYLFYEMCYVLLESFLHLFALDAFASIITSFCCTVFVIIFYKRLLPYIFKDMIRQIQSHQTSIYAFYGYLTHQYHFGVSVIVFIVMSTFLFGMVMLNTQENIVYSTYIKIKSIRHMTELKAYICACLRDSHFIETLVVTYFIYVLLNLFFPKEKIYACFFMIIEALYIYSRTHSLRELQYCFNYQPMRDFSMMIISQYVIILFLSIPILLLSWQQSLHIALLLLGTVILMSSVSILIPSRKDNPIHYLISFLMIMIIGFTMLIVSLLIKSEGLMIILFVLLIMLCIISSIKALQKYSIAFKEGVV